MKPPDETNTNTPAAPNTASQVPAAAATPVVPAAPNTAPQAPATVVAPAAASSASKELADDETPVAAERYVLTGSAIRGRVDRGVNARLKGLLGTDDPAAIKANKDRLVELETQAEQTRLAQLNDVDRAREEARIANERANAADERAAEVEERQVLREVDAEVKSVASEYINPKYWKVARGELSDFMGGKFTTEQLESMSEADSERETRSFFEQYAKDNPELAKTTNPLTQTPAAPAGSTNGQPPERVALTNGNANTPGANAGKQQGVIQEGPFKGKTLAPGRANSMTAAEVKDWKKANNIHW